jgi:erythromycin esterase-like protein
VVLLGEATHGTHEFYEARADITLRLIREKGFTAVAVEADWPDAYRINRFVRGLGRDPDSLTALADFQRFPRWMWRNTNVSDFINQLRFLNDERPVHASEGRLLWFGSLQPARLEGRGVALLGEGRS